MAMASQPQTRLDRAGADTSASGSEKTFPLMARGEIEAMIAQGRKLIIVDQYVLKVDSWLPYHPGGAKSIMHMVGKDATDEVNWSVSVSHSLLSYPNGM